MKSFMTEMKLKVVQVRSGPALVTTIFAFLAFTASGAHSAVIWREGHDWHLQGHGRQLLLAKAGNLTESKVCGPTALSGRVHFKDWRAKLPGSSLKRTGVACRHVSFGLIPFSGSNDLSVFLTPDRIDASLEQYSPPVVWARALSKTGFEACVYIPAVPGQLISITKDRVAISWMAIKGQKKLTSAFKVNYATEIDQSIDGYAICSRTIPKKLDPDADVILTSVTHEQAPSSSWFGPRRGPLIPSEAFGTWIQPTERSEVDRHEVCVQRLVQGGVIREQGMQVNMMGFGREKKFSGLLKLKLRDGRACKVIAITRPMYIKAVRTGQLQLSVRLHENDAVHAQSRRPLVSAWISERSEEGFTICAEQVRHNSVRGRSQLPRIEKASTNITQLSRTIDTGIIPPMLITGKEDEWKLRNSVQVSWIALPQKESAMVQKGCIRNKKRMVKENETSDGTANERNVEKRYNGRERDGQKKVEEGGKTKNEGIRVEKEGNAKKKKKRR